MNCRNWVLLSALVGAFAVATPVLLEYLLPRAHAQTTPLSMVPGKRALHGDMPNLPDALWPANTKVRKVLAPNEDFSRAMPFERMAGGAGTSQSQLDRNAYSHHTQSLSFEQLQQFKLGNALFNKLWVSSPSSTLASDGLGPFYNARACESCHAKDGRGKVPSGNERAVSLILQLVNTRERSANGDPVYGVQLHTAAVPGVPAEGNVRIDTVPIERHFIDGSKSVLLAPTYRIDNLEYGALDEHTRLSPRIAPSIIGQGLLEAIDDEAILAWADPDDDDGDGISGRANWQVLSDGRRQLGRFGLKAGKATVYQQSAHAFANDMGLSNAVLPDPRGDCSDQQVRCNALANGVQNHLGDYEVPDELLELVAFYASNLAVPARRDVDDPQVLRGKALFTEAGCVDCHIPRHVTSETAIQPEHRFQLIWPYSDLLLHDMGEELADGLASDASDGEANGREWRTSPLWGIGAATTVNPRTSFLHDGRAATPMEAVLWHGGEAEKARNRVLELDKSERKALVRFLDSL